MPEHDPLDRSIVCTMVYYGSFERPLTLLELHERLVPLKRLGGGERPSLGTLAERADALCRAGVISFADGLYAPAGTPPDWCSRRVAREKESVQKWRRMRRRAWFLQAVPFVRALLASGSLASTHTSPQSDWDVLVVAQSGRLYTARAGLLLLARLMGRLRTKHDAVAADRFCFNHYLTTGALGLEHRSLYVAHVLAALVPIHDPGDLLARVRQANTWADAFVSGNGGSAWVRRTVTGSPVLRTIARCTELVLRTPIGDWLEGALSRWQQKRITADPATHQPGGRVVANARTIEFHPRSFEVQALAAYNRVLERHGWGQFSERDSGLTR